MQTKRKKVSALAIGIGVGLISALLTIQHLYRYASFFIVNEEEIFFNAWDFFQTVFGFYVLDNPAPYLGDNILLWFVSFVYYLVGCMQAIDFLWVAPSYWQMILTRTKGKDTFHQFFLKGSLSKLALYTIGYFLVLYISLYFTDTIGPQSSFNLQDSFSLELFLLFYAGIRLLTLLVFQRFAYLFYIQNQSKYAGLLTLIVLAITLEADKALTTINLYYFEVKNALHLLVWLVFLFICIGLQRNTRIYWEDEMK